MRRVHRERERTVEKRWRVGGKREGKGGDNDTALPTVMKNCLVSLNCTKLLTRNSRDSAMVRTRRSDAFNVCKYVVVILCFARRGKLVCRNGSSQVAGLLLSGATKVAVLACSISLPLSLYSPLSVVLFNDAVCMYVYTLKALVV